MKRKSFIAVILAMIIATSAVAVLALDFNTGNSQSVTSRFSVIETNQEGNTFSMISDSRELVIYITADTLVHFEGYVPLDDEGTGMTREAREVLFGRTLAEVLDGRNLLVTFVESDRIVPISVVILFETAVTMPIDVALESGYTDIVTLPGEVDGFEIMEPIILNGEVVVNGEILEEAIAPILSDSGSVMVPLESIAQALGYDVSENSELQSIQIGAAMHIWIGSTEAHVGRMAPIELSEATILVSEQVFVPLDFFRNVMGITAYVFEGQVVVESYSDMR